ncbi:MAG: DUF4397 domain-containing protein [Polyangiales bacterium]
MHLYASPSLIRRGLASMLCLSALNGCDSTTSETPDAAVSDVPAVTDAATPTDTPATTDAAVPTDTPAPSDAGAPTIRVRVAHLSPNAPAVDVCLRPASASGFAGVTPTLASNMVAAGLSYTQVTAYLTIPAGTYVARLVAPGSTNCDTALAGLPDINLPALTGGQVATVAAVGVLGATGDTAFRVVPFVDDLAPAAMTSKVRFIHAAPGVPAVDVGLLDSMDGFTGIFNNVSFPSAAMVGMGTYLTTSQPLPGVTLAARPANANIPNRAGYPLVIDGVQSMAGQIITAFAIGQLGNDQTPLSALVCADNAPAMGLLTPCSVLPPRAFVRVAHLAPDAPAVDFCIRNGSTGDFAGPVLRGNSIGGGMGASFPAITQYLAVAPGAYTVRLVAPDATSCATSLAGLPDYNLPMLPAGARATALATGLVASGTPMNQAFNVTAILDGNTPPPAGQIKLRFFHAAPDAPAVDVGVLSGATFTPVFANTAFRALAQPMGAEMNTGYLSVAPLANANLQVRVAGMPTVALNLPGVNIPADAPNGRAVSVFAIGQLMGSGNTRLSAFVCQDRQAATGGIAPCTRVPAP